MSLDETISHMNAAILRVERAAKERLAQQNQEIAALHDQLAQQTLALDAWRDRCSFVEQQLTGAITQIDHLIARLDTLTTGEEAHV